MKIKQIILGGTFLFLAALFLHPQQEVVMSLKDGMPAIPLAIPEFIIQSSAPDAKSIARQLHQIISEDLKYSRVFRLLPKTHYSWIRPLDPKKYSLRIGNPSRRMSSLLGRFLRARTTTYSLKEKYTTLNQGISFLENATREKKISSVWWHTKWLMRL